MTGSPKDCGLSFSSDALNAKNQDQEPQQKPKRDTVGMNSRDLHRLTAEYLEEMERGDLTYIEQPYAAKVIGKLLYRLKNTAEANMKGS